MVPLALAFEIPIQFFYAQIKLSRFTSWWWCTINQFSSSLPTRRQQRGQEQLMIIQWRMPNQADIIDMVIHLIRFAIHSNSKFLLCFVGINWEGASNNILIWWTIENVALTTPTSNADDKPLFGGAAPICYLGSTPAAHSFHLFIVICFETSQIKQIMADPTHRCSVRGLGSEGWRYGTLIDLD